MMRQREHRERCKKAANENREFVVASREKKDKTFGKTIQKQLDNFHGEKKRTEEKLKALGSEKLTVTLTDYLKSPSLDSVLSMNMCTSVDTYLEAFCNTTAEQEQEEALSFLEMLNQEDMNQPDMLNLDSNQIETMDQHVWDTDASDWLDGLMAEMEEQSPLENNVDFDFDFYFADFVNDMIPDEWENVLNDVINNFDSNIF